MKKCLELYDTILSTLNVTFNIVGMGMPEFLYGAAKCFYVSTRGWNGENPGLRYLRTLFRNVGKHESSLYYFQGLARKAMNEGNLQIIQFIRSTFRDDCSQLIVEIDRILNGGN